jgi:hypothetical protein
MLAGKSQQSASLNEEDEVDACVGAWRLEGNPWSSVGVGIPLDACLLYALLLCGRDLLCSVRR